jgi:hypothetical protein
MVAFPDDYDGDFDDDAPPSRRSRFMAYLVLAVAIGGTGLLVIIHAGRLLF